MTPAALDRVFGRSRLKMVTGPYVEVYREATAPGARRRYTKRFIKTQQGDFREWTEREWRILARLVGHGARHVPDVVQYDRGAAGGAALVQTYDAGVTVDHWATLLPVQRGLRVQRHIFQDCAHWWALAQHLLLALHEIHALKLVHLDLKADNICLPFAPPSFHPGTAAERIYPVFEHVALIDFAFSLISGEALKRPLPIGWQRTFPYQSPRLLQALAAGHNDDLEPTRQLDWRCDMFSLAALLTCYLPGPEEVSRSEGAGGWTEQNYAEARLLLRRIRDSHDADASSTLPHLAMAATCAAVLQSTELAESLAVGWSLAIDDVSATLAMAPTVPLTPVTLIEPQPASAAPVTEIFIRPDHTTKAIATGRAWTVPAVPTEQAQTTDAGAAALGFEPAALATLPAVHMASPVTEGPAADVSITTTPEPAEPEVAPPPMAVSAIDVGASAPPEPEELPAMAPAVAAPHAKPGARDERRRAGLAVTYGLPLLGLMAASVWWLTAGDKTDGSAASMDPAKDTQVAADGNSAARQAAPQAMGARAGPGATVAGAGSAASAIAPAAQVTPAEPLLARAPQPGDDTASRPAAAAATTRPVDAEPVAVLTETSGRSPTAEDRYARRAREIVTGVLPSVVERASPRVGEVLAAAARAQDAAGDRRTLAAAEAIGDSAFSEAELRLVSAGSPAQGRQFNAAAHRAFWQGGDAARAFELQWQAFGAHPQDAEIAGNLAFYAMNLNPREAEMARGLAIYALATATRSTGPSRLEDWGSLAVASALSGRSNDSANAMLVLLTVSKDVNRSCRSALSSVASFGPALKEPAQALLSRVNARGAARTPYCEWPPRWNLGSKLP